MHCSLSDELQTSCRWELGDGALKFDFHSLVYILWFITHITSGRKDSHVWIAASLSPMQIEDVRYWTPAQFKTEGNKSQSSKRVNLNCTSLCCLSYCYISMFCRVQSSLSELPPEKRYQDDSFPASDGYVADMFLVKGTLSSLSGRAVET